MKIEHIAMYVKDLEKTKTFFETYLNARANAGYHNPKTDFRSYFLSFDDGARLEIMNKPQMQDSHQRSTDNRRRILRELRSGNRRQPDRDYCVAK